MASTVSLVVALMLSYQIRPADCFVATKSRPVRTSSAGSALAFRNSNTADGVITTSPAAVFAVATGSTHAASATKSSLPTWLSTPKGHLADSNLQELHAAMRASSFFTETESLQLLAAIEEAADGDRNKMAGAAEFCHILVETMEMGLSALIAAAFHFCSCVTAREQLLMSVPLSSPINYQSSSFRDVDSNMYGMSSHASVEQHGEQVVAIVKDAARLKQLEMVAARVMMQSEGRGRVSPDQRDAENLKRLLLSETKDWRALAIRSAACLYRLRGLLAAAVSSKSVPDLTPEAVRTAREALYIYAQLASRLGMHRLKNELEAAAFQLLYRRQYNRVNALSRQMLSQEQQQDLSDHAVGQSMREVLNKVKDDMTLMLQQDPEFSKQVLDFSVTARLKEAYSMWRKMLRHGYTDILQVPDALAVRIVLDAKKLSPDEPAEVTRARERALCYYAQSLCTARWSPCPENQGRFKDYIESPKRNGYQSLHYTACTGGWTLEIQIRSGQMHQVAEFGLASHWDYKQTSFTAGAKKEPKTKVTIHDYLKDGVQGDDSDHSSEAYLRKVQQWHWQQHGNQAMKPMTDDSSQVAQGTLTDIRQSRIRADRIRARTQRLEPYIQALSTAQSDLTREYVFCFLQQERGQTEGKVLALPAGACVLDALREGERSFGICMPKNDEVLALNGAATSVTRQLVNGDVLTVPLCSHHQQHSKYELRTLSY